MIPKDNDIANELQEIIPGAAWPREAPRFGGVPAGYFEELPDRILQQVRAAEVREELESLSPLLAAAPRTLPLSAPAGYFEQLGAHVLPGITNTEPIIAAPEAPVIRMRPHRSYLKWAAAACIAGLVGLSTMLFLRNNKGMDSLETNLSEISDQEIVDYLQAHTDAFDNETLFSSVSFGETTALPTTTDELSSEAIENYLDNTGLLKESTN